MVNKAPEAPRWRTSLDALLDTHARLSRLEPFRDLGLVPSPAATLDQTERLERQLGVPLPTAYRAFLRHSNGWQRFFAGADLLGTGVLGEQASRHAARMLLDAGLPVGIRDDRHLLPFGVDRAGTTLFAFDYTRGGREPSVLAWVSEIGLSAGGFEEFLELLLVLSRRDLEQVEEHTRALERTVLRPGALTTAA